MVEEIVRRHQFREGFELIDYNIVGLPIFRLSIEAVTMSKSSLPVMEEFILKGINIGITSKTELSNFYGIDDKLVSPVIDELHRRGAIHPKSVNSEELHYYLSEQGAAELQSLYEYRPQDELLVVDYDGLRRRLVRHTELLENHAGLRAAGAVQIRPYPALPPEVSELSIPQVSKVVRSRKNEFSRDILHLKKIVQKRVYFKEAVALVFRSRKYKEDIEVAFIVDEQQNLEFELKFAEHSGPKNMGFLKTIDESDIKKNIAARLGSKIISDIPSVDRMLPHIKNLADFSSHLASLQRSIGVGNQSKQKVREIRAEIEGVERNIAKVNNDMNATGIRTIYAYEYKEILMNATIRAKSKLILTSELLSPLVGTVYFFRNIENLARNGVKVSIYLYDFPKDRKSNRTFAELVTVAKRSSNISIHRRGGEKVHYLIVDDEIGIMTSRPFLGARGSVGFKCAVGVMATKKEYVVAMENSGKFGTWEKYDSAA